MKSNHTQYPAKVGLFLSLVLTTCLFAAAAHAHSLFTGKFTLTNEVRWGEAVLPPGEYSLALDDSTKTIVVSNPHDGKIVARVNAGIGSPRDTGESELLIAVRGNRRAVYSLRVAGLGELFQTAHPFPARAMAEEEARQTEAIPVLVAQK